MTFELTKKQLKLINLAIRAGIGDDGLENIGLSKLDQKALARIANDFCEADTGNRPYYD